VHWTPFVTLPWPFVLLGITLFCGFDSTLVSLTTIHFLAFTAAWPFVPQLSAGLM